MLHIVLSFIQWSVSVLLLAHCWVGVLHVRFHMNNFKLIFKKKSYLTSSHKCKYSFYRIDHLLNLLKYLSSPPLDPSEYLVQACCAPTLRFNPAFHFQLDMLFLLCFNFHDVRPVLSPSLLFYFSCTSPWLHYVPAVWNNIYFVALLNTLCVYFLFWVAEAVLPSAVACLFFLLVDDYLFFFFFWSSFSYSAPTPVIWFIVFTAVNFHLLLFFFQFFIWPLPCLLRLGAALWLWFWGVVVSSWILPTLLLAPPFSCDLYPLTFVTLSSVPCVACALWSSAHVALVLGWRFLLSPGIPPHTTLSPPHSQTTATLTMTHPLTAHRRHIAKPGSVPLAFRHGYSSPPSLRAAKVAKAAAAVANSSSSPVKELRDLSAMDAFRSRSISVSEHAVRRLEKSLLGNQTKNNNSPNTCCLLHGMVDGV